MFPVPEPERVYPVVTCGIAHETGNPTTVDLFDPQATALLVGPTDVINVQPSPKKFFYIGEATRRLQEKKLFGRASNSRSQSLSQAG
jgi:hypothetical protein